MAEKAFEITLTLSASSREESSLLLGPVKTVILSSPSLPTDRVPLR
jgi:hypothetical protein